MLAGGKVLERTNSKATSREDKFFHIYLGLLRPQQIDAIYPHWAAQSAALNKSQMKHSNRYTQS